MKNILVTGPNGFIGQNLCNQLEKLDNTSVLKFGRDNTSEELTKYTSMADFVFHLAAVMRPKDPSEFNTVNTDLTAKVLDSITKSGKKTPILITSSIQAELDNPYGKSKKAAEDAVVEWSRANDIPAYIFRLPNVFGSLSVPNYSSVVATFCYNISHGLDITINNPDHEMTLAYIDDVIKQFMKCLNGTAASETAPYYHIPSTHNATVQEIADILYRFRDSEAAQKPVECNNPFENFLYITYNYFKNI